MSEDINDNSNNQEVRDIGFDGQFIIENMSDETLKKSVVLQIEKTERTLKQYGKDAPRDFQKALGAFVQIFQGIESDDPEGVDQFTQSMKKGTQRILRTVTQGSNTELSERQEKITGGFDKFVEEVRK